MTPLSNKSLQPDKQICFNFRCQPRFKTKYGILVEYLNEERGCVLSRKERILQALSAYWLPFAYQKRGGLSQRQLQQIAREAIYHLQMHVVHLGQTFGIGLQPQASLQPDLDVENSLDERDLEGVEDRGEEDAIVAKW